MSKSRGSPRKFSEKIALLNKKGSQATAEFEKIIKEVEETTARVAPLFYAIKGSCSSSCVNSAGTTIRRKVSVKGRAPIAASVSVRVPAIATVRRHCCHDIPTSLAGESHHKCLSDYKARHGNVRQSEHGSFMAPNESSVPLRLPNIEISPISDDGLNSGLQYYQNGGAQSYLQQVSAPTNYLTDSNTLPTARSLPDISNLKYLKKIKYNGANVNPIETTAEVKVDPDNQHHHQQQNTNNKTRPHVYHDMVNDAHQSDDYNYYQNDNNFSTPYNSISEPPPNSYEQLNTIGKLSNNNSDSGSSTNDRQQSAKETTINNFNLPINGEEVKPNGYNNNNNEVYECNQISDYNSNIEQPTSLNYLGHDRQLTTDGTIARTNSTIAIPTNTICSRGREELYYVPSIKQINSVQMSRSTGNMYLSEGDTPLDSSGYRNITTRSNSYSLGDYEPSNYNKIQQQQIQITCGSPAEATTIIDCQCYECTGYVNDYYTQLPPSEP